MKIKTLSTLAVASFLSLGILLAASFTANVEAANKFQIGDKVVTTRALNARPSASLNSNPAVLIPNGTEGKVLAGPETADGYAWYQINYDVDVSGLVGWSAGIGLNKVKDTSVTDCSLAVGTNIKVQPGASLNVRNTPSLSGTLLGTQKSGAIGYITEGPKSSNGYIWWNINYAVSPDGWSVGQYITPVCETTQTTGSAYAKVTLDGVEVYGANIYVNSQRPYGPETNVLVIPPGGGTVLAGDYTYTYVSGGPTNSIFKNISATINSATGPTSLKQTLTTGGTITFYYNFVSKTTDGLTIHTPTVTSLSPNSGPVGTVVTVTGTGFTSTGNNISFNYYPNTVTNLASSDGTTLTFTVPNELCTYYTWNCNTIVPATYQITVVNANGTSLGKSFTVTSSASSASASGTIVWAVTLDGVAWTGSVVVNGVTPVDSPQNLTVPTGSYPGVPTGDYTYTYVSGGPTNSTLKNISNYVNTYSTGPTSFTQPLYTGGTITFYFNFKSGTSSMNTNTSNNLANLLEIYKAQLLDIQAQLLKLLP